MPKSSKKNEKKSATKSRTAKAESKPKSTRKPKDAQAEPSKGTAMPGTSAAEFAAAVAAVKTGDLEQGIAVLTPKRTRKAQSDTPKSISAIDAAAQVLRDAKAPMRCKEMITAMVDQSLWSSPNGKTPEATLASVIIREIRDKGGESRFGKADRGLFVANG